MVRSAAIIGMDISLPMIEKIPMIHLVGINPPLELEEEINKWYKEIHIPAVLEIGRVRRAAYARMVHTKAEVRPEILTPYIALYEYESKQDFEECFFSPAGQAGVKDTDRLPNWDGIRKYRTHFEIIKNWQL